MSTAEVLQTAQEYWGSAKARVVAVLDCFVSIIQWLAQNWKLVLFNLGALTFLGLIYWTVNSIGLRLAFTSMAFKLYKVPGLSSLRHYHGWRDLDLANVAAMVLLFLVWVFTVLMFHIFMYGGFRMKSINAWFVNMFIPVAGLVLVIVDALIFYHGVGEQTGLFNDGGVSLTQIIMTVAYSSVILAVAFLHCLLENR